MPGGVRVKAAVLGLGPFWRRRSCAASLPRTMQGNAGNREIGGSPGREDEQRPSARRAEQAKRPDLFICPADHPLWGSGPHRGRAVVIPQLSEVAEFASLVALPRRQDSATEERDA